MKLAYSTMGWTRAPIEQIMEIVADTGFHGIELQAYTNCLKAESLTPTRARKINRLASEIGIEISNLHLAASNCSSRYPVEPSFVAHYPELRERKTGSVCHAIDFAAELGINVISVETGALPPYMTTSTGFDYLIDSLLPCLEYAKLANVSIAIEPSLGHLIANYSDYIDFWNFFEGHSALGLCLDIGHAYCSYEDIDGIIFDAPDLLHVHMKDMSSRRKGPLIPGEGDIDLSRLLLSLDAITFPGFVSVELGTAVGNPEAAAKASIAALICKLEHMRAQNSRGHHILSFSNTA